MAPSMISVSARAGSYTAKTNRNITLLVIHSTGGSFAGDLPTLRGLDPVHVVSIHYYVTKQGKIYKIVAEKNVAWHAGTSIWHGERDCNQYSIGIELENYNNGRDPYPQAQMEALLELCRDIIKRYKIPRTRVVTHQQIATPAGRKNDPRNFAWDEFLDDLFTVEYPQYEVLENGTRIREGRGTGYPIAWNGTAKLNEGRVVSIKEIAAGDLDKGGHVIQEVDGKLVGSDQWGHMIEDGAELGFIWMGLLRPID